MKTKFSLCLLAFAVIWAGSANAQNAAVDCPNLPKEALDSLHWQVVQTPDVLLCRAVHKDNKEAFALTIGQSSPFKPSNSLRDKEGMIEGQKMWWYRSEIAGRPNELVRETMVKVSKNRVVHAFIRTDNSDSMNRYIEIVQGLRFDTALAASQ